MGSSDNLQLWGSDVRQCGNGDPQQQDRHGKSTDPARHPRIQGRTLDAVVGHADLSRQEMYPFTLLTDLSSLTTPLTVTRQPMESPSPCARRSAKSTGSSVVRSTDHGSGALSTRCGCAF